MNEGVIIFPAPDLSDEAAHYLCEFFSEAAMALERHYWPQLESYYKKMEPEDDNDYISNAIKAGPQLIDPEMPF
jgi:hypothetical protein